MNASRVSPYAGMIAGLVGVIFLTIVFVALSTSPSSPEPLTLESHPPRLILISYDGFRADYVSPNVTPTIWKLRAMGSYGNMFPNFGSKTFPNHFSIATGLLPETHGIVDNNMFDPELHKEFVKSDLSPLWYDNGYNLPIWIANQMMKGRKSGVAMWPGSATHYRGKIAHYFLKYNHNLPYKVRVDTLLDWMSRKENAANLGLMYMDQPDSAGHRYGPMSKEVREKLVYVDSITAYLIKRLKEKKLYDSTNLILISDHGMGEIKKERVINMTALFDTSLFEFYGGSQVVGILPKNPATFDQVLKMFREKSAENHYRVYLKSETPKEYHHRNHRRIQPIVLEAEIGYDIIFPTWRPQQSLSRVFEESNERSRYQLDPQDPERDLASNIHPPLKAPQSLIVGAHGNNNTQPAMQALFIALGPRFKQGFYNPERFFNHELYLIMTEVLDINLGSSYSTNGTSKVTRTFLRD